MKGYVRFDMKKLLVLLLCLSMAIFGGCKAKTAETDYPEGKTELSDFSEKDIAVTEFGKNIFLVKNNYTSESDVSYAWTIIDYDGENVAKEGYSDSREYAADFGELEKKDYIIKAFVKDNDGNKKSIKAVGIIYDKWNDEFIFDENFNSVELTDFESERYGEFFDLSAKDFSYEQLSENEFVFENNYENNKSGFYQYAWYVINADTKETIFKTSWSEENTFDYTFDSAEGMSFILKGFIMDEVENKSSLNFMELCFNSDGVIEIVVEE